MILTCNSSLAKLTAMTPAEQPMPARLYDTMLDRILKWLMIIADKEGVGLNKLQLTTKISICTHTGQSASSIVMLSHTSTNCQRLHNLPLLAQGHYRWPQTTGARMLQGCDYI